MKVNVYAVNGAVTFCDADYSKPDETGDRTIKFNMDPGYKFAFARDDWLFVSKDGKQFVIAISVLLDDQEYSAQEFIEFINKNNMEA